MLGVMNFRLSSFWVTKFQKYFKKLIKDVSYKDTNYVVDHLLTKEIVLHLYFSWSSFILIAIILKGQLYGGAMRFEANLPRTSIVRAVFYRKCITRKCLILKNEVQHWWWCHAMANMLSVWCIFAINLSVFEVLTFKVKK